MWKKVFGTALALALVLLIRGETLAVPTPSPQGVAVNHITNLVYISTMDRAISVIDGVTNKVKRTISLPSFLREGIAVNPTTNRIYATGDGVVWVINGDTEDVIATIPIGSFPMGITVNPATNRIYVTNDHEFVSVINGATNQLIRSIRVGAGAWGIGVNPDTNLIYTAVSSRNRVSVIDGESDTETDQIQVGNAPIGVGANPRTNRVYVANFGSDTLTVIEDRSVVKTISLPKVPWGVAVNTASDRIYVGSDGTWISIIDGAGNRFLKAVTVGVRPHWLEANARTNRVYVSNTPSNNVSVLYENERLLNASLDTDEDDDAMPDFWKGRDLEVGDQLDGLEPAYEGLYSFRFSGAAGLDKQLRQRLDIAGSAGSMLKLEGISRAEGAAPSGGTYGVEAKVLFTDGTSDSFTLRFKKNTHDWQREVASFVTSKSFMRVNITVKYEKQAGQAWFDALHLQVR